MNIIQKFLNYIGIYSKAVVDEPLSNSSNTDEFHELFVNIVTDKSYVICKSWEWDKVSQSEMEKFKKELLMLKAIAKQDNKTPRFFSEYLLPANLKAWLQENDISFEEN